MVEEGEEVVAVEETSTDMVIMVDTIMTLEVAAEVETVIVTSEEVCA